MLIEPSTRMTVLLKRYPILSFIFPMECHLKLLKHDYSFGIWKFSKNNYYYFKIDSIAKCIYFIEDSIIIERINTYKVFKEIFDKIRQL